MRNLFTEESLAGSLIRILSNLVIGVLLALVMVQGI